MRRDYVKAVCRSVPVLRTLFHWYCLVWTCEYTTASWLRYLLTYTYSSLLDLQSQDPDQARADSLNESNLCDN